MGNLIRRSLDTSVSPMVYVMTFVSVITGLGFVFGEHIREVQHSLLFQYGVAFDFNMWGFFLAIGAGLVLAGLLFKKRGLVEPGSMLCFLMWCFAAFTYF